MWSIRMRASKQGARQRTTGRGRRTPSREANADPQTPSTGIHISGAEGIYPKGKIPAVVQEYITRARTHPKGKPDSISITIEKIRQKPRPIKALPVTTVKCCSTQQAATIIKRLLTMSGISAKGLKTALHIVQNTPTMRGAALVLSGSGRRVDSDRLRGVRASRMGISKTAEHALSAVLNQQAIDTPTVREAIILASKVASCDDVVSELCISDDPDYTTGYIASKKLGYVRIPCIKKKGSKAGGRVFFLSDEADIPAVIQYMEKIPVMITSVSTCHCTSTIDEIIDRHHQ
jgi:6-carboxyhexanoate--CoA ligase